MRNIRNYCQWTKGPAHQAALVALFVFDWTLYTDNGVEHCWKTPDGFIVELPDAKDLNSKYINKDRIIDAMIKKDFFPCVFGDFVRFLGGNALAELDSSSYTESTLLKTFSTEQIAIAALEAVS